MIYLLDSKDSAENSVPDGDFLWVINEKVRMAVQVCDEEGENNVNGKEGIHDMVHNEERILLVC